MLGLSRDGLRRKYLSLFLLLSSPLLQSCASSNLRSAIQQNDAAQVRQMLLSGAEVNKTYDDGWTPLLYATRAGRSGIVEILVENGADIQARNRHGWSALLIASRYGYPDIVEFLIDNGAYVHTRNHAGYTPLMLATWGGHLEIIQILRDSGVRLDVKNDQGKTALYYAALNVKEDMVKYLLEEGAEAVVFEDRGEELFATAVTMKTRATIHEENGELDKAERDYRSAAGYFERAEPLLVQVADSYDKKQLGGVFASLLGLVASTADLKNMREGNPTRYSDLVPQPEAAQMSVLEFYEEYYREMARYSLDESKECLRKAGEMGEVSTE